MKIAVKRAYAERDADDGLRVLVDRLWPRGVSKDRVDVWLKDVAPSNDLRKWYGADTSKWTEFRRRYFAELDANPDAVSELRKLARNERVTLLFGKKDEEHNNAVALRDYLVAKRHN